MAATNTRNAPLTIDFDVPEWFNMATLLVDRHVAEGRGANPAIHYEDKVLTYADLLAATNRIGNALLHEGVGREERVALYMLDCPEWTATYLAAMKIGAVPLPINTLYTAHELEYCLADSRATTLVIDADLPSALSKGQPSGLDVIQEMRQRLPDLTHVIVHRAGRSRPLPGYAIDFEQAASASSTELSAARTHRDDPSYIQYSSGTTGSPKGVIHLHEDMVHCVGHWIEAMGRPRQDDVVYSVTPLFHSYGLVNGLYAPLMAGASMVLISARTRPDLVAETISTYHPSGLYTTPAVYTMLLNGMEERKFKLDASSLQYCISAGEALTPVIYDRWKGTFQEFGLELLDGIGSTENGYIYIQNRPGRSKAGTSGELLPGYEVEIRDETGSVMPDGEDGELYLASPSAAIGYWRKREQTKTTFCGQWLKTGDRYVRDADGYYVYLGRMDDMFKPRGQWTSPIEVEGEIQRHAAVAEAGVIGCADPDDDDNIRAKAYIVLREGYSASEALAEEIREHARTLLAPHFHKTPKWVIFVDKLPKNANGKIQRFVLREWSSQEHSTI